MSERYDFNVIAEAVELVVGRGNVTELRALNATVGSDRYSGTYSGYFDDPESLAKAVNSIRSASGIYFTPNLVNRSLFARAANRIKRANKGESTQDHDIVSRHWLLIDTDAIRPSGISSTDNEHDAAIARAMEIRGYLGSFGWPDPIAADSGNGGHLLYRVDLPPDDGGLIQRCLTALAARFDDAHIKIDTTVHNPARIWKLYGTRACKGDDVPDRPHRMSKILRRPDSIQLVSEELLKQLAAEATRSQTSPREHSHSRAQLGSDRFEIETFIRTHQLAAVGPTPWRDPNGGTGRQWTLPVCPWNSSHNDEAAYIVQFANGAIAAGCHHNGCAGRSWRDLRDMYEPKCARASRTSQPKSPLSPAPVVSFQPFPSEVIPEPIQDFIHVASKSIGCDSSYVALPLLAAVASLIGNARRIFLKAGWTEPSVIWTCIIGDSGSMKSPGFKAAMQPLFELQNDEMRAYSVRRTKYENDLLHYDKALREWKNKGNGEPPEKPEDPQPARLIVSDTTVEALATVLQANPRGVLLARDELAGWVGNFDRYASGKGADAAHWLSLFNAGTLIVDRKTGPVKVIMVEHAAVSVTGGIQPGTLRRVMKLEYHESGLLARVLFAAPPRRVKRWTETGIPPEYQAKVGAIFDRLRELKPNVFDDVLDPVDVRLTPEAKAIYAKFVNEHASEQAEMVGDLSAAWSKLEGYAARFALLVHFLRWAADDPTLPSEDLVDGVSVEAGITLSRWFGNETRRVYSMLSDSEEDTERRQLVEMIAARGGAITVRQLMQASRRFRTADQALNALEDLEQHGWGRVSDVSGGSQGGRPSKRFALAESAYVYETSTDSALSGGFVDVDGADSLTRTTRPARLEAARLISDARRRGEYGKAISLRDAWRERIDICTADGDVALNHAEHIALEELRNMVGIPPTIEYTHDHDSKEETRE